ncbi:MAG: hypothetical protein GXO12_02170 [Epsilonproteobacteria bacterium]|nr:hypothetical protein [Campylobacterota bacterium]
MKQSSEIITHLKNLPIYRKVNQAGCFDKLKSLLPPLWRKSVLFIYIKNKTLFFALNHPGLKMEFNYNHNLIKELLKRLKNSYPDCKDIEVTDIKAFAVNQFEFVAKKEYGFYDTKIIYTEKSTGNFKIRTNNKKLLKLFQNIQTTIKQIKSR